MKNIIFISFLLLSVYLISCKNNSDVVTNTHITPPPSVTGWVLDYHDYGIGTLFCNWPNTCFIDIVTDTIDLTNSDSMRIYMSYHSIQNNSLLITKLPFPAELYNNRFTDSTYGKVDKYYGSFNDKIFLLFSFDIGSEFTIDTLKIFKKVRAE